MANPDLAQPILNAILSNVAITSQLATYLGSPAIFTRRPAPNDAVYPFIMVSPDIAKIDYDGVNDFRPLITRDVTVYGVNDSGANYRTVENIAYQVFALFHRNHLSIVVPTWFVVGISCTGPIAAPVDDEQTLGRVVMLHTLLASLTQ